MRGPFQLCPTPLSFTQFVFVISPITPLLRAFTIFSQQFLSQIFSNGLWLRGRVWAATICGTLNSFTSLDLNAFGRNYEMRKNMRDAKSRHWRWKAKQNEATNGLLSSHTHTRTTHAFTSAMGCRGEISYIFDLYSFLCISSPHSPYEATTCIS